MDKNYIPRGKFRDDFLTGLTSLPYISKYCNDKNSELDIKVRGDYLNIYYKGGNLLKLKGKNEIEFDEYYYLPQVDAKGLCSSDIKKLIKEDYKSGEKISKSKYLRGLTSSQIETKRQDALSIHQELETRCKEMTNKLQRATSYEETVELIENMKEVMCKWNASHAKSKNERSIQHYISLNNRTFDNSTDYVVLDIEYALPYEATYFNRDEYSRNQHPRVDVVAIDRTGQIYIMELKYGMKSVNNKSGIKSHTDDFNATIGHPDKWRSFMEDIKILFDYQIEKGFISRDLMLDMNKKPCFAFIMKMEKKNDKNSFKEKLKQEGLTDIMTLYLPLDEDKNEYPPENYKLKFQS